MPSSNLKCLAKDKKIEKFDCCTIILTLILQTLEQEFHLLSSKQDGHWKDKIKKQSQEIQEDLKLSKHKSGFYFKKLI